jgi:hypothetical protein
MVHYAPRKMDLLLAYALVLGGCVISGGLGFFIGHGAPIED